MAQFTLHAYDADVWVPEFKGLNQADVMLNPDLRFAAEAENVETIHGVLQPQAATGELPGEFTGRVETFASFHRRWYTGSGSHDWYVCCCNGKFYQKQADSDVGWQEIDLPSGVTAFNSSVWSWVTYEINPENSTDTVDVLLMTNAKDGMIMLIPPDRPSTWGDWQQQTWTYMMDMTWTQARSELWHIVRVTTAGKKFGVIERFAERIWGGSIAKNPDMLMYSRPYDPTNWTAAGVDEQPEDGAGSIQQPSWDGDKFYALKRFGDRLLAFKKNRIWQVIGVSPGEYTFQEQFGGGTEYFNTIAVDKEQVLMMSGNGARVYDGMSTSPFLWDNIEQIWRTVNKKYITQMCATLFHNRYYVAFPVGKSKVNNAMLAFNLADGTILYYSDFYVETFLPTDDHLFFTSSDLPGRVLELKYDSWTEGVREAHTKWVTPWMDFGYKRIQKGGFDLYFVPEVKDEAVTLKISVQTEKKLKTKLYTVNPLTEEQREAQKEHRGKRLHFGGSGRKFRVIIEVDTTFPWRLIGGLQMVVETDPD